MVYANLVYLNNKTVLFPIEVKCRVSFIYAEKYRDENVGVESVRILCDTKIIPDEYTSMQFSKVQSDCVSKYGIVKSTICNPQLCISYAGNNILFAARLFSKLWDMKSFENDGVSAIALDVHNEAAALHSTDDPNRYDDIEFLITYYHNGNFHIERVRQGTIERDLLLANIGSNEAFEVFQKGRLSLGGNVSKHTESVFQDVVAGCKDDSVGGRVVEIEYDRSADSFVFHWENAYYAEKPQIIKPGDNIILFTSASDGGYSYEVVHQDIQNVFFVIDQMKPAILYSRQFRVSEKDLQNPNLFGLMLPLLTEFKEDGSVARYR